MPKQKQDFVVVCDQWDKEKAEIIEDWIDANAKNAGILAYDSSDHDQFCVAVAQALREGERVILFLTNRFVPLRFSVPVFQAAVAADPLCTGKKIFALAFDELERQEVVTSLKVLDAFSGDDRARRRRFVETVFAASSSGPKRTVKKGEGKTESGGVSINQRVTKARDVIAAAGDVNISPKTIVRPAFTPGEQHITSEQASRIKRLVDDLAEMDDAAGKAIGRSYQQWWKMLNNTFEVTTYKEIPRERFDEALSFLQQAKARNLPRIRRKDNELWRKKHYQVIFGIGKRELGWSEDQIHTFASVKLGKAVTSLSDLGERDLAKLARQIRSEARKR
jgi:hypothetical protein